jgi:hypothetical protein
MAPLGATWPPNGASLKVPQRDGQTRAKPTSANTLAVIDDLTPIRPRIDPAHTTALRAFQMRTDILPLPIRQAIQRHRRPMPAARPWIAIRRPYAIDQDGCEAISPGLGRRAAGPVAQPWRWLSTPRHDATEAFPRWVGKSSYPLGSEPCRATAGRGC